MRDDGTERAETAALLLSLALLWGPLATIGARPAPERPGIGAHEQQHERDQGEKVDGALGLPLGAVLLDRDHPNQERKDDTSGWPSWIQAISAAASLYVGYAILRVSREQRDVSARQADLLDRQLTVAYEPALYVDKVIFSLTVGETFVPNFSYMMHAIGPTPAIMRAYWRETVFADRLPPKPIPVDEWTPTHVVIAPDKGYPDRVKMQEGAIPPFPRVGRPPPPTRPDGGEYFLIARWVYDDVWGRQHEYAFCFRSGAIGEKRVPYGGSAYNYRRLRSEAERI